MFCWPKCAEFEPHAVSPTNAKRNKKSNITGRIDLFICYPLFVGRIDGQVRIAWYWDATRSFFVPLLCCKERRKTWYVSLLNSIQPLTFCSQARYTINTLSQGVWVIG